MYIIRITWIYRGNPSALVYFSAKETFSRQKWTCTT